MSGLKKCGCYDGVYSPETPTILVSVRCQDHLDVPQRNGYSLMHRARDGSARSVAGREVHTRQALSLANKRRLDAARSKRGSLKRQKRA